jgi:hypothetical protein
MSYRWALDPVGLGLDDNAPSKLLLRKIAVVESQFSTPNFDIKEPSGDDA